MNVVSRAAPLPTIALVHGGFLGAWIWSDVTAILEESGYPVRSVDLPSVQADTQTEVGDLYDDTRAVRELLMAAPSRVVLCGHSAGGMVISEAAADLHPIIARLVYLTAVVPDIGESMSTITTGADDAGYNDAAEAHHGEAEPVRLRPDGLLELDREHAKDTLFNDCTPTRAAEAVERLRPMNPAVGSQPVSGAAWRQIPSTLVRGTQDRLPQAVSPTFFDHEPELIELPTGHCPNWSQPELVAEILASAGSTVEL